jgi:hypothetical protein
MTMWFNVVSLFEDTYTVLLVYSRCLIFIQICPKLLPKIYFLALTTSIRPIFLMNYFSLRESDQADTRQRLHIFLPKTDVST